MTDAEPPGDVRTRRVLVVTVVHNPLDARIHDRELRSLLDAGHHVTYAAPLSGYEVSLQHVDHRAKLIDLPRSAGRRRLAALRAAATLLRRARREVDVVILHDPELLLALAVLPRPGPRVVWDVHEDLAASLADKPWIPSRLRSGLRGLIRGLEWWAERRCELVLAEHAYAPRFRWRHPVVPNYPPLPAPPRGPTDDRVIYLGRVSRMRGASELVAVGRHLSSMGVRLQVVGPVDADVALELERAAASGWIELVGFVPNEEALRLLDGALAGLSLLHDHENYRHSLPTKVLEYQAAGVPVVSTPLPAAVEVVERAGSGVIVPFGDVAAVVDAVRELRRSPEAARRQALAGRRDAELARSWGRVQAEFVQAIEQAPPVRRRFDR